MAIHTNGQSQDDHQSSSANTNTINTAIREGQLIYLPAKEFQFVTTTAIRQPQTIWQVFIVQLSLHKTNKEIHTKANELMS